MNNTVDFSPLASYSKFFLFLRWMRRIKIILMRAVVALFFLAILGVLLYVIFVITPMIGTVPSDGDTTTQSYSYSSSGSGSIELNLGLVLWLLPVVYFGPLIVMGVLMTNALNNFASRNGFTRLMPSSPESLATQRIPSFQGKLLATSVGPIFGEYEGFRFALHTREYKEGGVLRWRERQMDTIFTLILPTTLPHVVINARGNERARRSNLSSPQPNENKFQFEGPLGSKYDVYADPSARITALQLFTPDVLTVLYDKLPTADIEMKGDKLWIVQRYGILSDKEAQRIFEASAALYAELEKQIRVAGLIAPTVPLAR